MPWVDQSQTRVPERTYIWICALCLSNHRSIDLLTAEDLARTFKTRVQAIGIVLPLLAPWDNPVYVTRAWCLYELYQTLKLGLKKCTVNIDILLPPSQLALLQLRGCQYTRIRGDRPGSRSDPGGERHREPAVRPPGHREIISNIPGGFPLLNVTVQKSLRKWFTRHGAVDTASRWALFPTMMNLNIDGTTLPTTFGSNSSGIGSSGSSGINADRSGSSTGHRGSSVDPAAGLTAPPLRALPAIRKGGATHLRGSPLIRRNEAASAGPEEEEAIKAPGVGDLPRMSTADLCT